MSIEQVFKKVRIAVRAKTEGKQIPWESSSLVGDFYFLEKSLADPATVSNPTEKSVDPFGTWNMVVSTSYKDFKCQLIIQRRGSDIIGIFTSHTGETVELLGRLVANQLQFATSVPLGRDKVVLTITGYLEGDTIKGTSELPALRSFTFVANRIR